MYIGFTFTPYKGFILTLIRVKVKWIFQIDIYSDFIEKVNKIVTPKCVKYYKVKI